MVAKKHEIQRRYDCTAYLYNRRYREIQKKKYEEVLSYLKNAGLILDVGCGTGMFTKLLVQRAHFVVGVDLSLGMLHAAGDMPRGVSLVQADADHLPFQDGTFDVVVSITLLQNMPDPGSTVRELARVLKRGGLLIVSTLRHRHSTCQLRKWITSTNLKPIRVGRIPDSEDILCIARRQ